MRRALAQRFAHVLVDEFQDTDPCRPRSSGGCAARPADGDDDAGRAFRIRPGALFLVGDPKQAIYRFRGADVGAYVQRARRLPRQDPSSLLRSLELPLLSPRSSLLSTSASRPSLGRCGSRASPRSTRSTCEAEMRLSVAALDIAVAGENGKASAEQQRDAEADAVAELCARLIGNQQ